MSMSSAPRTAPTRLTGPTPASRVAIMCCRRGRDQSEHQEGAEKGRTQEDEIGQKGGH